MTTALQTVDPSEVQRALALLHDEGDTFEIRVLEVTNATWNGRPDPRHYSTGYGFFRDAEKPAQEAARVLGTARFFGAYTTLNPVRPELFSRAAEALRPAGKKDATTADADVPRRRWLLVDLDVARPSGISTTDAEHEAALALARHIRDSMTSIYAWPDPILADSGNGAHLLWQIALPGDDGGLVKRVLAGLQKDFARDGVDVDQTVFNPARITKLYGTLAAKGSNTPERPHRMSRILEVPEDIRPVPSVLLEDYAPGAEEAPQAGTSERTDGLDLEALIRKRWPDAKRKATPDGAVLFELPECPWEPEHNHSAFAGRRKNGALFAGCHGNRCHGKNWQDFKDVLGFAKHRPERPVDPEAPPVIIEITDHEAPPRPQLQPAAMYGLAGDYVRTVSRYSEADPVGTLAAFLVEAGCVIGRRPYCRITNTRHGVNENLLLVGTTGEGRKGTAQDDAEVPFDKANLKVREIKGLGSGEAVVWEIRDPSEPNPATGESDDPGQPDKRVLVREPEFAHVLKVIERDGSTLSPMLRQAWDGKTLGNSVKGQGKIRRSITASRPHVSLIGQITAPELKKRLTETETANGLGNRHLIVYVHRETLRPDGEPPPDSEILPFAAKLAEAVEFAQTVDEMTRDEEAARMWRAAYAALSTDRPGLRGEMTARAAQHVIRLSMIYALLDRSAVVRKQHLRAALALWRYCEESIAYVFGTGLGDPVADEIAASLQSAGTQGLTRDEIRRHFSGHVYGPRLNDALSLLQRLKLAFKGRHARKADKGRPPERWFHASIGVESVLSVEKGTEAA